MAILKNTSINDTGFIKLPAGTTAQRPSSPEPGMTRFNTTLNTVEWYDSTISRWIKLDNSLTSPLIIATGGIEENIFTKEGLHYRVHFFGTVGTSTFTVTQGGEVEYLIVAGGGAGGPRHGGGGGGGGMLEGTLNISPDTYNIVVGAGGVTQLNDVKGNNGQNSSAFQLTAIAGGGGGTWGSGAGNPGGSGGGGTTNGPAGGAGTSGQGFAGGNSIPAGSAEGAGGGGAGGAGQPNSTNRGGDGGAGKANNILGVELYWAGGGGGGNWGAVSYAGIAQAGTGGIGGGGGGGVAGSGASNGASGDGGGQSIDLGRHGFGIGPGCGGGSGGHNTGGGGGGGGATDGPNIGFAGFGGSGGSGVVIVRYRI